MSTPTVIVYFGRHPLPPLLLTPSSSSFVLQLLLRTPVGEHVENWDFKLSTAEFAYDTSVNKTINKKPHEIVYGVGPRQPIDHIPVAEHYRASESKFASHVHELHKKSVIRLLKTMPTTSYELTLGTY